MIDPIVTVALAVAFVITVTAILLTRRAAERPGDDSGEHTYEADRTQHRYVNGGWR